MAHADGWCRMEFVHHVDIRIATRARLQPSPLPLNYGVCSALVLTMTFANFGAVGKGDWDAYMVNVMMDARYCWSLETCTCPDGGDFYLRAAHLIADEP